MEKLGIETFFKSKKILITGNTGFKGGWLSLWISHMGAEVKGFSLDPPTNPSFFRVAKLNTSYETIDGDVRDYVKLSKIIKDFQPEIIFHLAAQPLVRYSYHHPMETFETNVMGTVNLLEASKKSNSLKLIINVTSDKCYENNESSKSFKEGDRLGGNDPYSSSKACAELVSRSFFESYFKNNEIQLATVRAGNVIGGGDWAEDRLIPDIYRSLKTNSKILIRNPQATRPWQHVLEPLNGYLILAKYLFERETVKSISSWNFGPNFEDIKSVEWILNKFKKLNSKIQYQKENSVFYEAQTLSLDISKARTKLNWHPRLNINKAIEYTNDWFENFNLNKNMQDYSLNQISNFNRVKNSIG